MVSSLEVFPSGAPFGPAYRLPECKGRTYEELDILFEKGVRARDFKGYMIDPYADDETVNLKLHAD